MNNKTVTSTLAVLISVACFGAEIAGAQDATDPSVTSESAPPAAEQAAPTDAPAPALEEANSAGDAAPSAEVAGEADANPYEASADVSADGSTDGEAAAPSADPKKLAIRWGAQLGYLFHTDSKDDFRAAKWMPIGAELGLSPGRSPWALVVKADVSPLCFGGHDCSGLQFRGLAGIEVGIQPASDSVLHMVYLNASLGYRYVSAEVEDKAGSTKNGKVDGRSILLSEVSASMMIPVTRTLSIGPRVAISSNLTSNTREGVSALQLGVRVLHAPGL